MSDELREQVARAMQSRLESRWEDLDEAEQKEAMQLADAAIAIIRPAVLEEAIQATPPHGFTDDGWFAGYNTAIGDYQDAIRRLVTDAREKEEK